MRYFSLILLSCVASFALGLSEAQAQTVPELPATLDVSWTLPTETECLQPAPAECVRLPLTGAYALTGVYLYVSTSPILDDSTLEPVASNGTVTSMTYNQTVPNGTTLYVRVKAENAFKRSVFSPQGQKLILVEAGPGAPTNVTVNFNITP